MVIIGCEWPIRLQRVDSLFNWIHGIMENDSFRNVDGWRGRKKLKNHAQYVHSSFTVSTAVWHPVKSTNFYVIIRFHIYQHIFIRRRSGDLQMSNHLLLLNKKALTKRIFIKKLYRERYCMLCWMLSVHSIHWKISCHNAS